MKRSSLGPLGEAEMEVLQAVWAAQAPVTVAQIHARILKRRQVAYTTIMTIMKKLADKGYLDYDKAGNADVYRPARPAGEVKHSLLSGILRKVFQGSPVELVESLVRFERLTDRERAEIQRILESLGEEDDDGVD